MVKRKRTTEESTLLRRLKKQEDREIAERRRKLANGFSRALLHLDGREMYEIEQIIYRAVGRSIVGR